MSDFIKNMAPDVFRKRFLIEGYSSLSIDEGTIINLFDLLVKELNLIEQANASVHQMEGKNNIGFYSFMPAVNAGIFLTIWTEKKFFSVLICMSQDFNERKAARSTGDFLNATKIDYTLF